MGFNTCLVILNDKLHDIEDDPDFGRKVSEAVNSMRIPCDINGAAKIVACTHSSRSVTVEVGGNTGRVIDPILQDAAMLIRKLLKKIPEGKLREQTAGWLQRNGLQG